VLLEGLSELELEVHAGAANFVLVRVGDGAGLRLALLQRGFAVRDCASFGLPDYIRIGVRRTHDCRRLLSTLPEALAVKEELTRANPAASQYRADLANAFNDVGTLLAEIATRTGLHEGSIRRILYDLARRLAIRRTTTSRSAGATRGEE